MNNRNLQQAIDKLSISDIYVREMVSKCHDDFNPKYSDIEDLTLQTKHVVTRSETMKSDEGDLVFRVFIDVGIKWINNTSDKIPDDEYLVLIEATFIAEYSITGELEQVCLDEFALKNVSYHVWPYWRELFSSQCERMRLPRILLPTVQLAQNQHKSTPTTD
ncbi:hypothetical protein [Shewanella baltica]|uniref:hypothetical protein n=1 Tax=Shewanella baltica TaxID=62322 RepID=UPI003D7BCD49